MTLPARSPGVLLTGNEGGEGKKKKEDEDEADGHDSKPEETRLRQTVDGKEKKKGNKAQRGGKREDEDSSGERMLTTSVIFNAEQRNTDPTE